MPVGLYRLFIGDNRGRMLAAVGVLLWLVPSYFEARTYSRLTGANVTMWDAMWVELRVQAEPNKEPRI